LEVCVPEQATMTLPVTIGMPTASPDAALFAAARAKLPAPSPWAVRYRLGDSLDLYVAAKRLAEAHPARAEFYPLAQGVVSGPAPQAMGFAQDGLVLRMTPGKALAKQGGALEGVLVLTSVDGSTQALAVKAFPGAVPDASFPSDGGVGGIAVALLLALLGGLILNLMPCVLPVLAMKAFALSSLSGRDRVEAVRESLAYGAGAILSFLALGGLLLALRSGGAAIGWGFQLQEPLVVALFALLMFGVGLNLSGVFEVAGFGGGDGLTRAGGMAGSFATGILAVAVAAPCTAPFMAAARRLDDPLQAGARFRDVRHGGLAGLGAGTAGRRECGRGCAGRDGGRRFRCLGFGCEPHEFAAWPRLWRDYHADRHRRGAVVSLSPEIRAGPGREPQCHRHPV